ncbi:MAG TPA: haloalkane dehalogenase [Coxiellaceae bacterium]|nr:MAG: haloalkane dehalogenase [Gammaproteobacteria bacterium RIFCSPHIGHO2_12_FULL_36_30]HLB56828.1 haloalkane dehalogenase [Coxiellaceae bacterium]
MRTQARKQQPEAGSHFISVKGSQIHYIDIGSGDPIVFLHTVPTSSYTWRHIISAISPKARCIAPDLIGMGQSDKPDIEYRVFDHIAYIEAFIDALKLKNITLVLHGWGSVIGFDYARRHEKNIKGIAFYESHLQPVTDWSQLSLPVQQLATLLNRPGASYRSVVKQNYFIEKLLPRSVIRPLTEEEMEHYRAPFQTPESRKPLWQYVNDLPLGKGPTDVVKLIEEYSKWLQKTKIPKLLLYAIPGFMTTIENVVWARDHFPNTEIAALDDALHLAQESVPEQFSEALLKWYEKVGKK